MRIFSKPATRECFVSAITRDIALPSKIGWAISAGLRPNNEIPSQNLRDACSGEKSQADDA